MVGSLSLMTSPNRCLKAIKIHTIENSFFKIHHHENDIIENFIIH